MVSTIRVGVHWHIRILQAVTKDSATIGQTELEELMKFFILSGHTGRFPQVSFGFRPEAQRFNGHVYAVREIF